MRILPARQTVVILERLENILNGEKLW